ncbi:MAG: hypothetical protein ACHQX1_01130 [Candidatus Micrarchaeales archaeon]
MDLLLKVGILIIALVIVASAIFLIFVHTTKAGPLTEQQAESLVLNDIISQNPNATVTVVSQSPSILANNSWSIVLSIVYNGTKPCPTLFIQGYDYPATGLVPGTDNLYTRGCVIYGLSSAPTYVISSPIIAIVRSYNNTNPAAKNFVAAYGYSSTNVNAQFYPILNSSSPLKPSWAVATNYTNVWLLNYSSTATPNYQYLIMNPSGQIVANYILPGHPIH